MSMQPMFTIQSRASSSSTTGNETVRCARSFERVVTSVAKVRIQSGMWEGASFWKNAFPNAPSGYRRIVNGLPFRCGTSTGATAR